jgi:hypothetical protein
MIRTTKFHFEQRFDNELLRQNAVGVDGRTSAPVPQIAAAGAKRVRSLDPGIARVEREG